jgi:hypothetical protein
VPPAAGWLGGVRIAEWSLGTNWRGVYCCRSGCQKWKFRVEPEEIRCTLGRTNLRAPGSPA